MSKSFEALKLSVRDHVNERIEEINRTRVIDACGLGLTLSMMEMGFANSWWGHYVPTEIQAGPRMLQCVKEQCGDGFTSQDPPKFIGAVLVEDPSIPAGEIRIYVRLRPELTTRLINVRVD